MRRPSEGRAQVTYSKILVPLDGSPSGERALPLAVRLAQQARSRVVFVRAVWDANVPSNDAEMLAEMDEARVYLSQIVRSLAEHQLEIEPIVVYAPAAEGILDVIRAQDPELVVMSTHGRSGLGRWIYGSIAEVVLQQSPKPVLLVRAWETTAYERSTSRAPRLLVPLDGSAFGEAALPHAVALASLLGARLSLLRVVPIAIIWVDSFGGRPYPSDELMAAEEAEAHRYLTVTAERLREEGVAVDTVVRRGIPAHEILNDCRMTETDIVIMATHGRTGITRLVFGSVALEVLHRGAHPVLVVRPTSAAETADTAETISKTIA
jgi:nucleotide-binding universal stress UspA family protein